MAACEMCGKEGELFRVRIEGSEMKVCYPCSSFGKVLGKAFTQRPAEKKTATILQKPKLPEKEIVQDVVADYALKIKTAREKMGLKQIELALKVAEKESLIHKMESGHFKPGISLAQKLERFLNIALVEETEITREETQSHKSDQLTLGDLVKIKK